jgi:hypothetical protein
MPSAGSNSEGPLELHFTGSQLTLAPEERERFVKAFQQAIAGCQGAATLQWLINRFTTLFLQRLHAWCEKHPDQVEACYVLYPFSREFIKIFVVRKSAKFDFELSDSIADLEIVFENAGWPCDMLQVASGAPEELQAFFNVNQSMQIYGHGATAPAQS